MSYFFNTAVNIEGNKKLRTPQVEAYIKIREYFSSPDNREALVVLPTGTGKSGLICISPYGVAKKTRSDNNTWAGDEGKYKKSTRSVRK